MSVSTTIYNQLGGNKFTAMTGAKNFVASKKNDNYLSFRIPRSNGVNFVKITLNGNDLYDIEFGYIRGTNYKVVKTLTDIQVSNLQKAFKDVTGLDTHL